MAWRWVRHVALLVQLSWWTADGWGSGSHSLPSSRSTGHDLQPGRVHAQQHQQRPASSRCVLSALTSLPGGKDPYVDLRRQSVEAVQAAVRAGVTLIELEFPPVKGKLDVSLGETLDANRAFARELARPFSANLGTKLWVVFPDAGEADLAKRTFGQVPFIITSIEGGVSQGQQAPCELQIVVNPGFNVKEWLQLQDLKRDCPMVLINGGLDKVRGGYYPRLFYPGLFKAKEQFLQRFEPCYYLKALPGGWIFRKYPEPWQVVFTERTTGKGQKAKEPVVLESSEKRPDYNYALGLLKQATLKAAQAAGTSSSLL